MTLSSAIDDFHLFYDEAVDMKILALLRIQCRVSDTQMTLRPVGLLFKKVIVECIQLLVGAILLYH